MASGYIGKISAVVTANTADLSKKLRSSTQEWNSYGASLNRSLQKTAAGAASSIDRILTPLQRLEKQLKAATSSPLNIRTEDQANQIRRLTSAAVQINQPLEAAAGSFQKLSSEVQAGFAPALGRAQNQAQALFKILEVGRAPSEKYFEVVQGRVDRTTQALQRLTQAQQIASRGFTGNELQFTNPAAFAALGRNAEATRAAASLSPEAMSFDRTGLIQDQVKSLARAQSLIQRAAAKVESLRLLPDADSAALANAEKRLSSLVSLSGTYRQFLLNSVEAANEAANAEQLRAKAAEDATKALIEREQAAKRIEQSLAAAEEDRIRKAQQAQDEEIRRLVEREQAAKSVEQRLAAAEEDRRNKAKQAQDEEIQRLIQREGTAKKVEQSLLDAEEDRRRKAKQSQDDEINKLIEKERRAKQVEEEIASAEKKRADEKKRIEDQEIQALIKREQAAKRLASASNEQQAKEAQIVNRRKQLAEELASRSSAGGLTLDLDVSELNAAQARINVLKRTISSLPADASAPAQSAISRLGKAISNAMRDGTIRTTETRREIDRLTNEAIQASAAVSGISVRRLGRDVARAGDIGRSGFDKFSLAANQAAFAIDDFFSSTGGIEFKIRAVQNNLTQLGFILGGTAGLFTALGAAIAGQAVVGLIKYINNGRTAEDVAKALTDALQKQKSAASELSNAFAEFGETISNDVLSDATRAADELSSRISKVIEDLKTLRKEQLAASSQEVANKQAELNVLDERIKAESDVGVLVALRAQRIRSEGSLASASAAAGEQISLQEAVDRFARAIFALEERRATDSPSVSRLEARINAIRRTNDIISQANIRNFADLGRLIEQRLSATAEGIGTGGVGAFTRAGDAINRAIGLPFSRQLLRAEEASALEALRVQTQDPATANEAARVFLQETERLGTALADARKRLESFGEESDIEEFSAKLDAAGKTLSESLGSVEEAISGIADGRVTFDELKEAIEKATNQVNAETDDRRQLVRQINTNFSKQASEERDERKSLIESIRRQRQQVAEQARKDAEDARRRSAERGAGLVASESEKFANELRQGVADIEAFVGPRTVDNVRRSRELSDQFVSNAIRQRQLQVAPAVFALQDQIRNAALGGPSRAALSASDIRTQQGTSELNRLLRGDDPARDQNIVELRKQTAELVGLREDLKNLGVAD